MVFSFKGSSWAKHHKYPGGRGNMNRIHLTLHNVSVYITDTAIETLSFVFLVETLSVYSTSKMTVAMG